MSNQSRTQVIAHARDCRNRRTAFECNAQLAAERVSGPTVPHVASATMALASPKRWVLPKNQRVLGPPEQPR